MNSKRKIIFSIIIPAFNEEKLLPLCLKAVFRQNFPKDKYEVIVVNNASTDNTVKVAKKFPVKIVHQPKKGLVLARQKGLENAKGEYFINLDADTVVPKDWLKKIYNHFKKDKKIGLITGPCLCKDESQKKDWLNIMIGLFLNWWYRLFKTSFAYYGGNVAFKKNFFLKAGGYDLRFPYTDQLSLIGRLKKVGAKIVFDNKLLVYSSPRRTKGRLLKFLFKEVLIFYFLDNFYRRLKGKSLGQWEDIR